MIYNYNGIISIIQNIMNIENIIEIMSFNIHLILNYINTLMVININGN